MSSIPNQGDLPKRVQVSALSSVSVHRVSLCTYSSQDLSSPDPSPQFEKWPKKRIRGPKLAPRTSQCLTAVSEDQRHHQLDIAPPSPPHFLSGQVPISTNTLNVTYLSPRQKSAHASHNAQLTSRCIVKGECGSPSTGRLSIPLLRRRWGSSHQPPSLCPQNRRDKPAILPLIRTTSPIESRSLLQLHVPDQTLTPHNTGENASAERGNQRDHRLPLSRPTPEIVIDQTNPPNTKTPVLSPTAPPFLVDSTPPPV